MPADEKRLQQLADHVFSTWNTYDVDAVLACYTQDLVYLDPNTRGPVVGRDAMGAYLSRLFGAWRMTWKGGELFPLESIDGVTIRWTGSLVPVNSDMQAVEISGLDLVILDGDLVARNEVYFDRSALAAFLSHMDTRS
jgi:hypothetical protein